MSYVKIKHKNFGIGFIEEYNIKGKTKIKFKNGNIISFKHDILVNAIEVIGSFEEKNFSENSISDGSSINKNVGSNLNIRNTRQLKKHIEKIWRECVGQSFPRHVEILISKKMSSTQGQVEWNVKNKKLLNIKLKISDKILNSKSLDNTIRHELAHLYVLVVLNLRKERHGSIWKKAFIEKFNGDGKTYRDMDSDDMIHAIVCSECGSLRKYNFRKTRIINHIERLDLDKNPTKSGCCGKKLVYIGKVLYKKKYKKNVDFIL